MKNKEERYKLLSFFLLGMITRYIFAKPIDLIIEKILLYLQSMM